MVCMACLSVPLIFVGLGSSYYNTLIGFLITILSLTLYLHYKEFSKNCIQCI